MGFQIILMLIVMVLCIGFGFFISKKTGFTPFSRSTKIDIRTTVKEILPIAEFSTLLYHYQAVMTHSDDKKFPKTDVPVPLTGKKVIYTVEGAIHLGFDGKDIKIDSQYHNIIIYMPKIRIMHHDFYDDTFSLYDEQTSLFNHYSNKDSNDLRIKVKAEQAEKVENNLGLFIQAKQSAEQLFKSLLGNLPGIKNKYEIVFEWEK